MRKLISLIVLIAFSITFIGSSFAEDTVISAEMRMKALAIKREQARAIGSGILIGFGILTTGLGLVAASQPSDTGQNFNLMGGLLIAGMGGILIALGISEKDNPLPLEISYREIASMESATEQDKAKREAVAGSYLKKYADEGFRDRMLSSVLNVALGAAYAADERLQDDKALSYTCIGIGVLGFFLKTDVEYECDDYVRSKTASGEVFVKTESSTKESPVR